MQGGRQGLLVLPWVSHFCPGTRSHLRAAGQTPGLVLRTYRVSASPPAITDLETPDQELSPWGNPLGKVARNPKPHFLRFQCLGRFQNLDRTSVCQTQDTQAWSWWDRAAGPSGNEIWEKTRSGPRCGSSLVLGITASICVLRGTHQAHACPGRALHGPQWA